MARYRLRFQLQEFDLREGITLIGRTGECQVTIDDPLVSRQHARIVIEQESVVLEDLGSRNGVKLNGASVRQPMPLQHSDRIRIGAQELVFCIVRPGNVVQKNTGILRQCAGCGLPRPKEVFTCTRCGSSDEEERTLTNASTSAPGSGSVRTE